MGARPHVCGALLMILVFVSTLADGLCCALFIYLISCWCWCKEMWTSAIDWAQLNSFHLRTETETSLRNVLCSK
jgi:hypothetical protein